jgi:hypothetical protein
MKLLVETSTGTKELYDSSVQALLRKDVLLANMWNLCIKTNEKSEIPSLTLANVRLIIDSLEQIQQHT